MRTRSLATDYQSQLTILVFFFWVAEDPVYSFSLVQLRSINLKTDRWWTWWRVVVGAGKVMITHGNWVATSKFGHDGRLPDKSHHNRIFIHIDIKNAMRNVTETTKYYGINRGPAREGSAVRYRKRREQEAWKTELRIRQRKPRTCVMTPREQPERYP